MVENRPSKKQRELLQFIDGFIKGYGYGPSYREIMRALGYKSVSTVAIHIDGLIARGYLRKKDHSARSIEVVTQSTATPTADSKHVDWLRTQIQKKIDDGATEGEREILQRTLEILGIEQQS